MFTHLSVIRELFNINWLMPTLMSKMPEQEALDPSHSPNNEYTNSIIIPG
jgi:hypothetical protein